MSQLFYFQLHSLIIIWGKHKKWPKCLGSYHSDRSLSPKHCHWLRPGPVPIGAAIIRHEPVSGRSFSVFLSSSNFQMNEFKEIYTYGHVLYWSTCIWHSALASDSKLWSSNPQEVGRDYSCSWLLPPEETDQVSCWPDVAGFYGHLGSQPVDGKNLSFPNVLNLESKTQGQPWTFKIWILSYNNML